MQSFETQVARIDGVVEDVGWKGFVKSGPKAAGGIIANKDRKHRKTYATAAMSE